MDGEVLVADTDSAIDRLYLFDDAGDNAISFGGEYFDQDQRKHWRYQWHGYNRLYYNPAVTYDPWSTMGDADDQTPRSNPMLSAHTQDMDAAYTDFPAPPGQRVVVDDGDVDAVSLPAGLEHESNGTFHQLKTVPPLPGTRVSPGWSVECLGV